MDDSRWEHGSEFDLPLPQSRRPTGTSWREARYYGTGRDALRHLIRHGVMNGDWGHVWIPSYFCQEVARSMSEAGIEVSAYRSVEVLAKEIAALRRGRPVVLVQNFFGTGSGMEMCDDIISPNVIWIEDHTHDPLSEYARGGRAHWCIASLRKTIPIPDGATVWSPQGLVLPPQPELTDLRYAASSAKLASMILKAYYLAGYAVDKAAYRGLAISGEKRIADGEVSGISQWSQAILGVLPLEDWRQRRRANFEFLATALANVNGLRVLTPRTGADTVPYAAFLELPSQAKRDAFRAALSASRIYAAIHWPLDDPAVPGIDQRDVDRSRRVVTLHCDFRYSCSDLERVVDVVTSIWRKL